MNRNSTIHTHKGSQSPVPVLAIRNLSVSYDSKLVLENVNLDIMPGDKITLIGEIGSGKTTLQKCTLGTVVPRTGHILLEGTPLSYKECYLQSHWGCVPLVDQHCELWIPFYSIKENIVKALLPHGIERWRAERLASECLKRVQLESKVSVPGTASSELVPRIR